MTQSIKDKVADMGRRFRDLFTPKAKRRLAIALSAVLIGGAVYLNWLFFFGGQKDGVYDDIDAATGGGASDILGAAVEAGADTAGDAMADDNAQSVASYFAVTTINRQRARDEAIEVLQSIVEDVNVSEQDKSRALDDIRTIAANIEHEANIETLIEAKGFNDCVAVINSGKCTIVVESSGLLPNQIAQIQEIVYQQTAIPPANLTIIEKSA